MLEFFMKIAITGKGGVGKTTLSSILSHLYAKEGKRVVAVDADPDANLAQAFGLAEEQITSIRPISELKDLIAERTGARPGSMGGIFKLNPKVDDIPEEFGCSIDGITLLIMGKSKEAASGCYCPENVFLRRLLSHLVVERDEVVVVDMEAGIEHLTRGTAQGVDAFIVVVEPGQRSVQTAHQVAEMAEGIGVRQVYVVANKIHRPEDLEFIKKEISGMELLGTISFRPEVMQADIKGKPPYEISPETVEEVSEIKRRLDELQR